jgi:hypothetical protein
MVSILTEPPRRSLAYSLPPHEFVPIIIGTLTNQFNNIREKSPQINTHIATQLQNNTFNFVA